jgi:hypothetical protein
MNKSKESTHVPHHYEKNKILPREKNECCLLITIIAEIRLAALLARVTLLVFKL